jgi:putative spermidine/putrescine transport system permease protein
MTRMTRLGFRVFVGLVFVFLVLPMAMVVVTSFSRSAVLAFPPSGFTLRWYANISPEFLDALKVSVIVALGTTAVATLAGAAAALGLVRSEFPGKAAVATFCLSPLMVPTLVIGVAAFRFTALLWDAFGLSFAGTIPGIVMAQSAFTIPFVVRATIAGHAHLDRSLEEAARNLGATPLQTFFKVTLPLLVPGIASGAIFAFVMSFDDVPVALFMGGGSATTFPVKIYTSVEFNFDADLMAISTLVVVFSLLLMLVLDRLIGLQKFFGATTA